MKLSLKQKALLITTGILASMILGSGFVALIIQNVPATIIADAFIGGVVVWMLYLIYSITLNRLEYLEATKEYFAEKD